MKKVLEFFCTNWDKIGVILVGGIALLVYVLQKRDVKKNAATLVVTQIESLKEKIANIVEIISNNQLNATSIYETLDILDDNQWNKYKHLFVGDIDANSLRIIDSFYEDVALIREQLILAKKIQQNVFFNNQQLLANDCNCYLMQGLEQKFNDSNTNLKELIESVPANDEQSERLKEIAMKITESTNISNNQDSQFLNTYFFKTNQIKDLFGRQGLIVGYLPEQIHVTIEKQLNKISHIEIIGCSGYKKLKKFSKLK